MIGDRAAGISRVGQLTEALVATPSVVNTAGEHDLALRLYELILAIPYFRDGQGGQVRLVPTHDDRLRRYAVIALAEGTAVRPAAQDVPTVVLTGHFDTVGVDDFGNQKSLAFASEALTEHLLKCAPDDETRADLAGGEWLPGRGSLDMKSGIATNLWTLEQFCANPEAYAGNLLFVATPDEEDMSKGMEAAVLAMRDLAEEHHLRYVAAINNDYTAPRYPGDPNRYAYLGSIGKVLPSFYVFGKETHVGQAFEGLEPNWLVAEITSRLSYNMELAETVNGECTPPPVALKQADSKDAYTVQTAIGAHCYFNFFTFYRTPEEVLAICKREAEAAFAGLIARLQDSYDRYCEASSLPRGRLPWRQRVLTYEELYQQVLAQRGEEFQSYMADYARKLAVRDDLDLRAFGSCMVEEVWRWGQDKSPVVIVYYCSSYWPAVGLQPEHEKDRTVIKALTAATSAGAGGYNLQLRRFYPYISEMSMVGRPTREGTGALAANTPGWGLKYAFDFDTPQRLDMPIINLGPFGKDAHKCTERVHKAYSFEVLPRLTLDVVTRILHGG